MTLICVTLNAPNDWADHAALLDYGFSAYSRAALVTAGEILGEIALRGGTADRMAVRAAESFFCKFCSTRTIPRS